MKKHISKTIIFKFTNTFTKQFVLSIETPYLPFKSLSGYYSDLYKKMKAAAAFQQEKHLITGKKWFENKKTDRTIITLDSGVSLDMPYDLNKKDIGIINHYLQGLKMAIE